MSVPCDMPSRSGMFVVESAAARIDQIRIATGLSGLCFRCRNGFVTRRVGEQEPRVLCTQINQRMPPDVAACSRFINNSQLTIFELIQLCDPVDILSRQRVGFKNE